MNCHITFTEMLKMNQQYPMHQYQNFASAAIPMQQTMEWVNKKTDPPSTSWFKLGYILTAAIIILAVLVAVYYYFFKGKTEDKPQPQYQQPLPAWPPQQMPPPVPQNGSAKPMYSNSPMPAAPPPGQWYGGYPPQGQSPGGPWYYYPPNQQPSPSSSKPSSSK